MGEGDQAYRSAAEAVSRRCQAASWLQRMIGPLDLPIDPCEEDLRLFLKDGNAFCKLVNKMDPALLSKVPEIDEKKDSSCAKESLRKFLRVISLLKLSTFEVLDLEQPNYQPMSSERVVDCLLSLKSYHEWAQGNDRGFRRHDAGPNTVNSVSSIRDSSSSPSSVRSHSHQTSNTPKSPSQPRKRWILPENDSFGEADFHATHDIATQTAGSPQLQSNVHKPSGWEANIVDENFAPSSAQAGTALTSAQIHQITQRFREIMRFKTRGTTQDQTAAQITGVLNSLELSSSQSVSSLANSMLGDKQHEDVSNLVELMLKRVMEDFERRLISQNEQVANLKSTLREHLTREDRLVSRARNLETLVFGSGEEVKIVKSQFEKMKLEKERTEDDLRSKELLASKLEKEVKEGQALHKSLERQLLEVKQKGQEHIQQLEVQKQELKQAMQEKLDKLEALQGESNRKMQELEAFSAAEMQALRKRDEKYQAFLSSRMELLQDIKVVLEATKGECLQMQNAWHEESKDLGLQLQGLAEAASGYHNVLAENRKLYNEVQDLKGNIRVYCRVRPFLPSQTARQSTIEFIGENGDLLVANPMKQGKDGHRMFSFNKSFGPAATQEEVFMDTRPLIRSVLDGYNVCIFAYGQTGSGKTYTMTGPSSLSEKDWGVNYRALNDLFHISQSRADVCKYEVGVQMVEIYNEQVRDLLLSEGSNKRLEIRNYSQLNGLNVPDASMLPVMSTTDVLELIKIGQKNRAVGATALNERSSRSHSVLTVHVQGTDLASGSILHGCLHLVDLAGSERVDRSEATGDRLKEAQHINKSLSALGDVVSALAQKSAHVPYRNSKLTQLLQNSLAGQAKTLMFVHISPDMDSYGETVSTLKFAERVASVELGAARSNKESREVRDLREQVTILKDVIAKKDVDLERLQTMRNSNAAEEVGHVERLRVRPGSGFHFHKPPPVQMKQTKARRQTVDFGGHKEKWIVGRQYHASQSHHDLDMYSPPASPKESKRLQSGSAKEKFPVDLRNPQVSSSESRAGENSEVRHGSSKEAMTFTVGANPKLKDWQDRVHSSTDSSLFGTSSVDDLSSMSDGVQMGHPDGCTLIDSVYTSSVQDKVLYEPLSQDSSRQDGGVGSKKVCLDRSGSRSLAEVDTIQPPEPDTGSELSDGYVSQAETEISISSIQDQSASIRKDPRSFSRQRKPPPPPMPRPSRGEWKSVNLGQAHSRANRQQSVLVSPAFSMENMPSRKQPLSGQKHTTDITSTSDAATKSMNQNSSKSLKRWL